MNANPFHNGRGELPSEKFSGRCDLLRLLEPMIHTGSFAYLIEGERGYGKTSIRVWLESTYAKSASTVICALDMADFQPPDPRAAYEDLIDRLAAAFRKSLASKNRKAEIEAKIKDVLRGLKLTIPTPFGDIEASGAKKQPTGIRDFLSAIYAAAHGNQVNRIVFVFDEISSRQSTTQIEADRWAWNFCAEFVSKLIQLASPDPDVAMGVILLTYPGDIFRVPIGFAPDRHLTGRYSLNPFDLTEVQALVAELCPPDKASIDSEFPRMLFTLSGGSPDLVQAIGYGAYRKAAAQGRPDSVKLQSMHALFAHVEHAAVVEKAVALVRWKMPELLDWLIGGTPEKVAFRKALKKLGSLELKKPQCFDRSYWIKFATSTNQQGLESVTTFFDIAVERGLMIVDDEDSDRLRFLGEMLRHAVGVLATRA